MSGSGVINRSNPDEAIEKLSCWMKTSVLLAVGGVSLGLICTCAFKALGMNTVAKFAAVAAVASTSLGAVGIFATTILLAINAFFMCRQLD